MIIILTDTYKKYIKLKRNKSSGIHYTDQRNITHISNENTDGVLRSTDRQWCIIWHSDFSWKNH